MRIALVTETYPPELNGVAMTLGHLVAGLRQRAHRVDVIRPRQRSDQRPGEDILVRGLPFPGYSEVQFGLPAPRLLLRLWRTRRPDLVHIVTEGPLGWSALWVARRLGIPVTSSFHTCFDHYCGHYGLSLLQPVMAAWLHALHRRTLRTFVPTRAVAETLREHGIGGLRILGRGCDTQLFNPQRRRHQRRAAWGLQDDALACLYVGRLAPEKNLDLVEKTYAAIQRQHPGTRMIWVGDGPSHDALVRRHPDHVFAGAQTGVALAEHYASADLFIFPSLTETYGNVVPEAMASGLAVVAYDRASAAELVTNGVNGCTVASGDATRFVDAAVALAGNRSLSKAMGSAAAQQMRSHSWDKTVDIFEQELKMIGLDRLGSAI